MSDELRLAQFLGDVGQALTRLSTLGERLQGCSEAMVNRLDASLARIWSFDESRQILELQCSSGLYTRIDGSHARVPLGKWKIGLIASERKPHLTNDVAHDPRVHDKEWASREGMVAFAGHPLLVEDRLVGVMAMFSRRPLTEIVLQALASAADSIALGIENVRLLEEMKRQAVESERQRLARELHDSVSQALYGIGLAAKTARGFVESNPPASVAPLDYVLELAHLAQSEMRTLILELRPETLENEGLVVALGRLLVAAGGRRGWAIVRELGPEPAIDSSSKHALYRIAQEALHNIDKHARARQVEVRLREQSEGVHLQIVDDGVGFASEAAYPGHLGLVSMRERATGLGGSLAIESGIGRGSRVDVFVPRRT